MTGTFGCDTIAVNCPDFKPSAASKAYPAACFPEETPMHTVSELMVDTVFTLQPTDTLNDARTLMKLAKIRNTPVADDEGNF